MIHCMSQKQQKLFDAQFVVVVIFTLCNQS